MDSGSHSTGSTFLALVIILRSIKSQCKLRVLDLPALKDKDRLSKRSNFDGVQDMLRGGFGMHLSSV